ncbi:MAG: SUMF1/EgtB/PvdO family nonheme iron enzyme [Planctomycetota bacterium]
MGLRGAGRNDDRVVLRDGLRLASVANIADVSAKHVTLRISNLDDGYAYTAPVGTYGASPFGLHDVYGNVSEWCSDMFLPHDDAARPLAEPLATSQLSCKGCESSRRARIRPCCSVATELTRPRPSSPGSSKQQQRRRPPLVGAAPTSTLWVAAAGSAERLAQTPRERRMLQPVARPCAFCAPARGPRKRHPGLGRRPTGAYDSARSVGLGSWSCTEGRSEFPPHGSSGLHELHRPQAEEKSGGTSLVPG